MADLPESLQKPIDVLMIDNFDSFTWNLYQSLSLLGADVTVIRNDAIHPYAFPNLKIRCLIISPGPGHPKTDSGISRDAIKYFTGKVPILGVCMGLECLVDVFGGHIAYAGEIKHGKLSPIRHDNRGVFRSLPQNFLSTRYHSLSASQTALPPELAITAITAESGVIMGVRHRKYTLEAVQYHPESVLSESGDDLLKNFLELKGGTWEENPSAGVLDLSLPPFPIDVPSGDGSSTSSSSKGNKLPTILEKIHQQRLKDIDAAKRTPGTTPADLSTLLSLNLSPPLISVLDRLQTTPETTPALMAEIKRASPSKGPIAMSANAAQQALVYALAGASVISVLTEPTWFKGSLLDMRLARQAVDALPNRPAVLRKDFIVDEYQIQEARLHGADTVLLIVAMLPVDRLSALYKFSKKLGMEPLVEVNNAKEMDAALAIGARLVGVNNRNLHNFEVDMGTTSRLVDMVREKDVILCALSGISEHKDVETYVGQGVRAVLVGEALMRAEDTAGFIRELLGWPEQEREKGFGERAPLVKICGIRSVEEAKAAYEAGADMLGLMFVPTSKRRVEVDEARKIAVEIRTSRAGVRVKEEVKEKASGSLLAYEADEGNEEFETESTTTSGRTGGQTKNVPWFTLHANRLSRSLSSGGRARPFLVGVFQDQPLEYILDIVSSVQLDAVQLHGNEPLAWARLIGVPVIRVFHVKGESDVVEGITRPGLHEFVLLDSVREGKSVSGGSGKVVDLELAKRLVEAGEVFPSTLSSDDKEKVEKVLEEKEGIEKVAEANEVAHESATQNPQSEENSKLNLPPATNGSSSSPVVESSKAKPSSLPGSTRLPIILAGGLTASNVREAVERVRPWAVDVSGGVENDEGTGKDVRKMIEFVRAAKGVRV